MCMKQTIELNSNDIKHLVAKEFNVKEEQVTVFAKKVYRGIYELEGYEVYVTVNK